MEINRAEIGQRIREALGRSGVNQKRLAEETGVSPPSVTAWLQGTSNMPVEAYEAVSRLCGVSIDWIILGGSVVIKEDQEEYCGKVAITPEEENLLKILEDVPDIHETIKTMIELPERKRKIYLGKMLEELEKLEDEKKKGAQ
jgi:transcriptional regulator with XRE-family HTH domain